MPHCRSSRWAIIGLLSLAVMGASEPPIEAVFCQALVKHVPSADVAYQPGVDVRGKPVVPADLAGGYPVDLPQEITIPLTVDMMQFLKLDSGALPASAMQRNDLQLGALTIRGDQVLFNGKPLTNQQQDNLAVLCMKPHQ